MSIIPFVFDCPGVKLGLLRSWDYSQILVKFNDDGKVIDAQWVGDTDIARIESFHFRKAPEILETLGKPCEVWKDPNWLLNRCLLVRRLDTAIYPLSRLAYDLQIFWSGWDWWKTRIIGTLWIWGLADIREGEIVDWYCVVRKLCKVKV